MAQSLLDAYTGTASDRRIHFDDVDQQYRLKIRAFINLCMPAILRDLERDMALNEMRSSGVVPIMFALSFETYANHLGFKGRIETEHTVRLCRDVQAKPKDGSQPPVERLLVDMNIDIAAQTARYDPHALGGAELSSDTVPAGRMRAVHVLTKPTAPAGQRGVTQVPTALSGLVVHSWDEPYPSVEGLQAVPTGYEPHDSGEWREQRTVWGLSNTDINQHVNVVEYITNIENHFARMLHGARLAVVEHRVERTDILFRKPSFMGDVVVMRGDLYTNGEQTLLLAGFYSVDNDGEVNSRPNVFARISGRMLDDLASS